MKKKVLLTRDEEKELGTKIQTMVNADKSSPDYQEIEREGMIAVDKMVRMNEGLVLKIASKYKATAPSVTLPLEDLVQEGMIGLLTAIYKFDPTLGNKFSTMAYYWIRQAVVRGSNKTARMVYLPENRITDLYKINKARTEEGDDGVSQVMEDLNITDDTYNNIMNASFTPYSIDFTASPYERGSENCNVLGEAKYTQMDKSNEEPDLPLRLFLQRILWEKIDILEGIEKEAVESMLGLIPESKADIARRHKIKPSKMCHITNKAIKKIRTELESEGFRSLEDFNEVLNQK